MEDDNAYILAFFFFFLTSLTNYLPTKSRDSLSCFSFKNIEVGPLWPSANEETWYQLICGAFTDPA